MPDGQFLIDLPLAARAAIGDLLVQGYTIVKGAEAPATIGRMAAELAPHFEACPACDGPFSGRRTARFSGLFAKSKVSRDLALKPEIHAIVRHILGPNCDRYQIHLTQAISIKPGEGMQPPHTDDVIFQIDNHGTEFMLNVMWPLTKFTGANGATLLWPGTHRRKITEAAELFASPPVAAEAEPGDAIVWLGSVMHCGGANRSDAPREGVVISYSLGWLRQAENQYLTYAREELASFPPELLALMGFVSHRPNLGWVNGDEPYLALEGNKGIRPARDLFDPATSAKIEAYFADRAAAGAEAA